MHDLSIFHLFSPQIRTHALFNRLPEKSKMSTHCHDQFTYLTISHPQEVQESTRPNSKEEKGLHKISTFKTKSKSTLSKQTEGICIAMADHWNREVRGNSNGLVRRVHEATR